MTADIGLTDRNLPALLPGMRHCGYHVWTNLLFVHWRVPAEILQPLLPRQLTLDTFQGEAWVGLVPFHMSGVRPRWSPAVPGVSNFHETNVRTYVHYQGGECGVWFFSLDAANRLAVTLARRFWHLNYHLARMLLSRNGDEVQYRSARRRDGAGCDIRLKIGDIFQSSPTSAASPTSASDASGCSQIAKGTRPTESGPGFATPGTLEHFLVERYLMYAAHPSGKLLQGRVRHSPYPLRHAALLEFQQTLLPANRIPIARPPEHVLFSEGVSVEVFPLRPLG